MAGCTFEMNGYTNFQDLTQDLANVLIHNGFTVDYPSITSGGVTTTTTKFTLRAGVNVDPLAVTQPWCIQFDASDAFNATDPGTLRVFVGTPIQLAGDGTVAVEYPGTTSKGNGDYDTKKFPRKSGELTCGYFSFVLNNSGGQNSPNNDLAVPFASKGWGELTLYESELASGFSADPTDASVSYVSGSTFAKPLSFRVSISDHGLALVIWEEGEDLWGNRFSWLVVQRPVNSETGKPLVDTTPNSRCPVFCVYSIGGGDPSDIPQSIFNETSTSSGNAFKYHPLTSSVAGDGGVEHYFDAARIYRMTVRERDVNRPTVPVLATIDTPDNKAIINGRQQVAITEGNQYVISFINGFNTARYMYKEEMDMLTYTSADVLSMWSDVSLTPYKDAANGNAPITMKYKAMHANLPNNAGMRILLLIDGNGVSGNCSTGTTG